MRDNTFATEQLLRDALRTIGSSQLDLYLGSLTPEQIAEETILYLQERQLLQPKAYLSYLGTSGYQLLPLSDGSNWTLRWGLAEGRYVHLHPGRYALHTLRVKANHLKTAIAASIACSKYSQPAHVGLLNQVRAEWLELPPIKSYTSEKGLGSIFELVQGL
ncbi:hypothetical protein GCM10028895_37440 [Pontibacter rugosus]